MSDLTCVERSGTKALLSQIESDSKISERKRCWSPGYSEAILYARQQQKKSDARAVAKQQTRTSKLDILLCSITASISGVAPGALPFSDGRDTKFRLRPRSSTRADPKISRKCERDGAFKSGNCGCLARAEWPGATLDVALFVTVVIPRQIHSNTSDDVRLTVALEGDPGSPKACATSIWRRVQVSKFLASARARHRNLTGGDIVDLAWHVNLTFVQGSTVPSGF